jgi:hypothetical protein
VSTDAILSDLGTWFCVAFKTLYIGDCATGF